VVADPGGPDLKGTVLDGKYRLERRLGEGGMGVVWEAEHVFLKKRVACKLLRAEIAAIPDISTRFAKEAQAASAINHPNVVQVTDFGCAPDGTLYLVMALLAGRSLADELSTGHRLSLSRALHITIEVLSGLEAAHQAGVVHRDLKPENIFLASERVLLVDFGIARLQSEDLRLTGDGAVMGTPLYMAPEQARGQSDVDARADLHSVGVVLYEMLSGRTPYRGDTFATIAHQLLEGRPPPLSEVWPEAPAILSALVGKSLAADRTARFQTATEMKDALGRLRTDLGAAVEDVRSVDLEDLRGPALTTVPARRRPDLDKPTPPSDDRPIALATRHDVSEAPVELARKVAPPTAEEHEEPLELVRRPEPRPQAPPPRSGGLGWILVVVLIVAIGGAVVWLRPQLVGLDPKGAPSTVRITITSLPAGSKVFLDGAPWPPPYDCARDNRPHSVRVESRGRLRVLQLVPDSNQQLDAGF